ncbi:Hypothetical predicted protein, partial [Olea europaea subsp. europaea]
TGDTDSGITSPLQPRESLCVIYHIAKDDSYISLSLQPRESLCGICRLADATERIATGKDCR